MLTLPFYLLRQAVRGDILNGIGLNGGEPDAKVIVSNTTTLLYDFDSCRRPEYCILAHKLNIFESLVRITIISGTRPSIAPQVSGFRGSASEQH